MHLECGGQREVWLEVVYQGKQGLMYLEDRGQSEGSH